ncbi:hypothetical protein V1499_22970 (plasmid) [Neobacillus sp. SCS-31]|uniref:hypothetical protein n=1 Tax=Neobacillus oceani TaxID=3115292 RepID=UPI003905EA53
MFDDYISRYLKQQKAMARMLSQFDLSQLHETANPTIRFSNKFKDYLSGDTAYDAMLKQSRALQLMASSTNLTGLAKSVTMVSPMLIRLSEQQEGFARTISRLNTFYYRLDPSQRDASLVASYTEAFASLLADGTIKEIEFEEEEIVHQIEESAEEIKSNSRLVTAEEVKAMIAENVDQQGKFSAKGLLQSLLENAAYEAVKYVFGAFWAAFVALNLSIHNSQGIDKLLEKVSPDIPAHEFKKVAVQENVYLVEVADDGGFRMVTLGFLREESFLREGSKRTAPLVTYEKLPKNAIVTILERKGNWVKIQVHSDNDLSGEVGWLEESKVNKFEKIHP